MIWHPRCPKMSLSKKRKVDTECRVFQEKWSLSYLFTEVNGKPVCLVCSQHVSVLKEYNLRRHNETLHAEKYNHSREISDTAVKAGYLIANEIALTSKPFSEVEFVKMYMLKAAEIVFPEKRQALANISLTRNTLVGALDRVRVDRSRAVSLATDCAPSMIGKKTSVATRFREKVQMANGGVIFGLFTVFCIRRHCVASH